MVIGRSSKELFAGNLFGGFDNGYYGSPPQFGQGVSRQRKRPRSC